MIDVNWDLAPEGAEELVQFESHVTWRKGIKIWCMVQQGWCDYVSDFKVIATRPTQKTVADEAQEGEKWTHVLLGDKAYIKVSEPDCHGYMLVVTEGNGYNLARPDELKPIKPTMTKEQHEFLCKFSADSNNLEAIAEVESYLAKHDII